MTDRELEKKYLNMIEEETPDFWNRIESQLEDKEAVPMKESFGSKVKRLLFSGSIYSSVASVCMTAAIVIGVVGLVGGLGLGVRGMGSAKSYSNGSYYDGMAVEEAAAGDYDYGYDSVTGMEASEAKSAASENVTVDEAASSNRKLIRNIYYSVETLTFDTYLADVKAAVTAAGGYIESSSTSGNSYGYRSMRSADFTIRMPQAKTDAFLEQVGNAANVVSNSENVRDITLQYVDTESRVKTLRTEEAQLLKFMEQAETIEDLMSVESRLTEVRYQLESYESQLKSYDNQVNYDTIELSVSEVKETTPVTPPTLGQRIANGFKDSLESIYEGSQDLVVLLVVLLPYLLILAVIVLVIRAIVKTVKKRKKK